MNTKVIYIVLFSICFLIILILLTIFAYWTTCHPCRRRYHTPTKHDTDIDFVVTWVDSSDQNWLRKKNLCQNGRHAGDVTFDERRFGVGEVSNIEIETCVKSIIKYASWCRYIWIVTDEQEPKFYKKLELRDKLKVRLIFHNEFFVNPSHLPVFNSHSIEANIHNIPGLCNRFIYMNDDFCFSNKVTPEHFFEDDCPVYRSTTILNVKRCPSPVTKMVLHMSPSSEIYLKSTSNLSDFGNRLFIWRYDHHAVPLRKDFFDGVVCSTKFRCADDIPPIHFAVLKAFRDGKANVYVGKRYNSLYLEEIKDDDYKNYHEICVNNLSNSTEALKFQCKVLGI